MSKEQDQEVEVKEEQEEGRHIELNIEDSTEVKEKLGG